MNDRLQTLIAAASAAVEHFTNQSSRRMSHEEKELASHEFSQLMVNLRGAVNDVVDSMPETVVKTESDRTTLRHESYGTVSISLTTGRVKLFGSVRDTHDHYIMLRINRACAELTHGGAGMKVYEDYGNKDRFIAEVALSSAQWAELITTMNTGTGVPCTLRSVRGREMARVPEALQDNSERIVEEFRASSRSLPENTAKDMAAFKDAVQNSKLSKKDQERLLALGSRLATSGHANATWVLQEFNSAAAKLRAAHLTELDASVSNVVHKLGLERLQELLSEDRVIAIPASTEEEM